MAYNSFARRKNKYGAKRQLYNGVSYDSKLEARVAIELDARVKAGYLKAVERQYRVEIVVYGADGKAFVLCRHRVDFRVQHTDDSFELIEAKGLETPNWKKIKRWLEHFWLPEHLDHIYTVVKEDSTWWYNRKRK